MRKNNTITFLFSLIVGIGFVFFVHFNLLRKVPGFYCEGFGCIGLGIIIFVLGGIIIPLIFGIAGFILSKEKRLIQAVSSLGISLVVMVLSFLVINFWNQIDIKRDTEEGRQATQELYEKMGIPLSQESQSLPLLDSKRPITITNQLTSQTVVVAQSPFTIQAYVRDDAVRSDNTVQSEIKVSVPGTIERKTIGSGTLSITQNRSPDGRLILEGILSFNDIHGETTGILSVIGKDGVTDTIYVTF